MSLRTSKGTATAVALLCGVVLAGCSSGEDKRAGPSSPTTTAAAVNGVTRTPLGQATPTNAPGQVLYLQQVTIAPGAKLAEHYHEGTQLAAVQSGTLTYNIISGTVAVTRAGGRTEQISGPQEVQLEAGDSLVETPDLVHFGANRTDKPVVIQLAPLLARNAPLATPVGEETQGTPLHLTTSLESETRNLLSAGEGNSVVYGWNHLVGTATAEGQPVGVNMLGSVNYAKGTGPFSGFITFTFSDKSTLAVAMQGFTQAAPDSSDFAITATLGVIGGTGRYLAATGTGTFTGSRQAAVGTAVESTFDLKVQGVG